MLQSRGRNMQIWIQEIQNTVRVSRYLTGHSKLIVPVFIVGMKAQEQGTEQEGIKTIGIPQDAGPYNKTLNWSLSSTLEIRCLSSYAHCEYMSVP